MKKSTLLLFACLSFALITNAQTSNSQNPKAVSENIYTALKPADGVAYVFGTQAEMDAKQLNKKGVILSEIKANENNPQKLTLLRQDLWRIENATVLITNK